MQRSLVDHQIYEHEMYVSENRPARHPILGLRPGPQWGTSVTQTLVILCPQLQNTYNSPGYRRLNTKQIVTEKRYTDNNGMDNASIHTYIHTPVNRFVQ